MSIEQTNNYNPFLSSFYAYRLQDQIIENDINTKVEFNSTLFNINNDFNIENHNYIAPIKGYYIFSGNIVYNSVISAKKVICRLRINNIDRAAGRLITNTEASHGISLSLIYLLNKNDIANLWVYHNFGEAKSLARGNGYTQFSGGLIHDC